MYDASPTIAGHGGGDYLVKPFETEDLEARIDALLRYRVSVRQPGLTQVWPGSVFA